MKTNQNAAPKIGVVTLPGLFNYGNRLQNYAVVRIYRKLGYATENLELLPQKRVVRAFNAGVKKLIGRGEPAGSTQSAARTEAFKAFGNDTATRVFRKAGEVEEGGYAFISTGSDQVWNPTYLTYCKDWYFLKFVQPEKRIALAASIGLDDLTPAQAKLVARGVEGFRRISVRERRGAEVLRECAGVEAEVVCDPTLVLSAEEWRAVADGQCTPDEPYVFTYLLGGVGSEASDVLDKVTDHGRIPVVSLSDRQKPNELDAGPAEFIDLIDHASHVVTDSFHAAVFSSILHTPLTIVHREGGASMFSRLEQLSQTLDINEKVYGSPTYDLAMAGEYGGVDEAIGCEREKFMKYLEGCLDG